MFKYFFVFILITPIKSYADDDTMHFLCPVYAYLYKLDGTRLNQIFDGKPNFTQEIIVDKKNMTISTTVAGVGLMTSPLKITYQGYSGHYNTKMIFGSNEINVITFGVDRIRGTGSIIANFKKPNNDGVTGIPLSLPLEYTAEWKCTISKQLF